MPFVHLANGEVLDLSDKEWKAAQEESNTPNAFHKDGHGSHVIGVYPSDYDYEQTEEDVTEQEDRAAFEDWKRNRNNPQPGTQTVDPESATRNDRNNSLTTVESQSSNDNDKGYVEAGKPVTIERDSNE
jgi:hypothetical protein